MMQLDLFRDCCLFIWFSVNKFLVRFLLISKTRWMDMKMKIGTREEQQKEAVWDKMIVVKGALNTPCLSPVLRLYKRHLERLWEDPSIIHTRVAVSAPQFGICLQTRNQSRLRSVSSKWGWGRKQHRKNGCAICYFYKVSFVNWCLLVLYFSPLSSVVMEKRSGDVNVMTCKLLSSFLSIFVAD